MKTTIVTGSVVALMFGLTACSNRSGEGRFLNLSTGREVEVVRNEKGEMVNKKTGKPVLLYTDDNRRDTFFGLTGERVNGHLRQMDKGVYVYNDGERIVKIDGEEYKIKDANSKEKWDADGDEYKYKEGDAKVKIDKDDYKQKGDGYTKKVDEDGDVKIETKDKKIKIDGETGERKVKERSVFGKAKDKVLGD
jgi:hypothetical protein